MKKNKPIKGYYTGTEFPEYYGKEIEIRDDYSTKDPCYEIRFIGEGQWHNNMDDDDWQATKPEPLPFPAEANLFPCGCPMDKQECKDCTRFS